MSDRKTEEERASPERRRFLKLSGTGAFTAAMMLGAAGMFSSETAVAQTAKEEKSREAEADHTMIIATSGIESVRGLGAYR